MSSILMVTRPIVPPWDEGSKNTAWQIATNARRHEFHLMTARRAVTLPSRSSITSQPVYTTGAFGLGQRCRLPVYLVRNRLDVDIYHFLFVPTLLTSVLLSTIVGMKRKRSVQTVPSLYRERISPTIARRLFFADEVVALSDWTARRLRSLGIQNVTRINAGVDLHRFRPPSDRPGLPQRWGLPQDKVVALFSGELSRLGSLEIMLSIAPEVLAASPDLHLVFASPTRSPQDSAARRQARERLRQEGLEESVAFLGDVDDFSALLRACDMFLFPVSTMTGKYDTPLTVLEAMATGLPVILTDLPPLNEVLRGEGGIATPPGDNDCFAEAVVTLAHDRDLRCKMGGVARTLVKKDHSVREMVRQYESLYDGP